VAGGIVVATFTFAIALGGESIAERTLTLFAQDPVSLHASSRGGQLVYVRRLDQHLSPRCGPGPLGHDQRAFLAAVPSGRSGRRFRSQGGPSTAAFRSFSSVSRTRRRVAVRAAARRF
jgi:hypothetical protein